MWQKERQKEFCIYWKDMMHWSWSEELERPLANSWERNEELETEICQ
jgi:hypothetical protein